MIYLIGSLANPRIPYLANDLRAAGFEVFDDWFSAGALADTAWRDHERIRGRTFQQALLGAHAQDVFAFDYDHLSRASTAILIMPCGRSGHLELGWAIGRGKRGYVLLPGEPDRFDVMYNFCTGIYTSLMDLIAALKE